MPALASFALAAALPLVVAQSETVLGVYMFHRHGDRTPKVLAPANLTTLGYEQVYTSGQYYRSRYVASDAQLRINGINADIVKQSQISASAPDDTVLQNSAEGFLQGLYPPVPMSSETLRDGRTVQAPMDGYQLIPVELVSTGGGSEDNSWLQSAQGCAAATISSNEYFSSTEYLDLLNSTRSFYQNLLPVINSTFTPDQATFKNAYTIFDYLNVAEIHNKTIPSDNLLTNNTIRLLQLYANEHEWGLAYNASNDMRAIAGKTLAAEIVQFLNGTLTGKGKSKMGIQFGAYATFASFFGLADLAPINPDFEGIVDYASAMVFEMFTNGTNTVSAQNYPSADNVYVRFLFHNSTTTNTSQPEVYPLFGSGMNELKWNDFQNGMNKFAIGDTADWCKACGNSTGKCAAFTGNGQDGNSASASSSQGGSGGNGLSPAVNGVIGAMVTLAVVLGLEALILLVGGLRVVSKKRMTSTATPETTKT